jgi:hypothetical protein
MVRRTGLVNGGVLVVVGDHEHRPDGQLLHGGARIEMSIAKARKPRLARWLANGHSPHRSLSYSWTSTTPTVPLPTMAPSRPVPSAALKRTRGAFLCGAPQRAVGCFRGFTGSAGVVVACVWALLMVAALPLEPDPALLQHPATSTATTATPRAARYPASSPAVRLKVHPHVNLVASQEHQQRPRRSLPGVATSATCDSRASA